MEREALLALYDSTDGPNWDENAGWATADANLTNYYGVEVNGSFVQELDLSSNGLKGSTYLSETMRTLDRSDRIRSDQIRSDQIRSDRIRSDQIRSDQIRSDQIKSDQIGSDQIRSDQIRSDHFSLDLWNLLM